VQVGGIVRQPAPNLHHGATLGKLLTINKSHQTFIMALDSE